MPRTATIESLPEAFEMIKQMRAEGLEWGEDYRCAGREAVAGILERRTDGGLGNGPPLGRLAPTRGTTVVETTVRGPAWPARRLPSRLSRFRMTLRLLIL